MWSSFTVSSTESPATVRNRLAATLTTAAPGWLTGPTTFRGVVSDAGFRITRNLARMENSMPIVADGKLSSVGDGTTIEIATRPQGWIVFLMCLWSAMWVKLLWMRLVYEPLPGGIDWCEVAVLVGFAASGWCILFFCSTLEERQYRTELIRIFTSEVEPGPTS